MASEQDDFVDRIAQAVIDKIEQRDQTEYLVNQVVRRVIEMQKRDAELKAKSAEEASAGALSGNTKSPSNNAGTED